MKKVKKNTQHSLFHINKFTLFYIVSFLEGAAVMIGELAGAKMIAPFYGNSLYVWTSVLGTTLIGLASGYYLGGIVSKKYNKHKSLSLILCSSAVLFVTMPWLSTFIMETTISLSVSAGSLISSLVFIFPVLMCFGMVSPLIISIVSEHVKEVGNKAGTVYAISTVGGIIMTFVMGFYFIPYAGLKASALLGALMMLTATVMNIIGSGYLQNASTKMIISDQ